MADLTSRRLIALKLCAWRTIHRKKNNRRVRAVDIACSQLIPVAAIANAPCSSFRLPIFDIALPEIGIRSAKREQPAVCAIDGQACDHPHLLRSTCQPQLQPAKQCHPKRKETPEGGFRSRVIQSCSIRTSVNWDSTFPSSTSSTSSPPRHGRWRWFHSRWLR